MKPYYIILLLCLLTVPTIDPIPIERFSEYVCDMLQDDKKNLIKEFSVSFSYTLSCIEHASIYISVYTVWEEHIIMCGNIIMYGYSFCRTWTNYQSHPPELQLSHK